MSDTDRELDDVIRRAPVPPGLPGRLTPGGMFVDAAIDRALGEIPLPPGLTARVLAAARRVATADRPDGAIDLERFSTAAAPTAAVPVSKRRTRLVALARELSTVAAALGLAGLLAAAGIELSRRLEGPAPQLAVTRPPAPPPITPEAGVVVAADPASRRSANGPADLLDAKPTARRLATQAAPSPPAGQPARLPAGPAATGDSAIGEPTVRGAPVWVGERSPAPTMITVASPRGVRRPVPRSAAFDLAFEMAHGEAPFSDPAADAALAIDRPPLTLRTDGFDSLLAGWQGQRSGGLRGRLRVEEVLAALPPPPALTAAGGPAIRLDLHGVSSGRMASGRPTTLLEVAIHAAGDGATAGEPRRTTLIIDQSAAGDGRGWRSICRGIGALAGLLGPADRTTVILCGPRPRVALEAADPAALRAAAADWVSLPAAAAVDLDAALELAATARLPASRAVVVAHGVTLDRGHAAVRQALAGWHHALAVSGGDPLADVPNAGFRCLVIDPTAPGPAREDEPTFGRTGLEAAAIRRDLIQQVTGRDTLAARQCRLEVRFDPARVARYRIVGHRQTAVESLAAGPPEAIDLHVGETLRVVYEIVPRQDARTGLAAATLTWRTPDGGVERLEAADRPSGDRGAGLPSPHGCTLLLATGLAELAAGSPHLPRPRSLIAQLEDVAGRWQARGDLTPLGAALIDVLTRRPADQRTAR
jgi:hypothetical protein